MNTRRMNYARAPQALQNGPWTGAPQVLQKFRPVGGGGGIGGAADATALGRAASSADATICTSASRVESALFLERMYKKAPTPIAARTATPATAPPMIPADAASAPLPPELLFGAGLGAAVEGCGVGIGVGCDVVGCGVGTAVGAAVGSRQENMYEPASVLMHTLDWAVHNEP